MMATDSITRLITMQRECSSDVRGDVCVKIVDAAALPTRFGDFQIVAFYNNKDGKEHVAIVKGDVVGKEAVPVRIHSDCLTGDALGSLRCDCRDQLIAALQKIDSFGVGIVLYMRQEGRGIGLINKIRAYALQDQGYDTVEADQALGFSGDERTYDIAARMLELLEVRSVRLITNNPLKLQALAEQGIPVVERIPHVIEPNDINRVYLETKQKKAGHLLDLEAFQDEQHETLLERAENPVTEPA